MLHSLPTQPTNRTDPQSTPLRATLLAVSTLTIMAGATIAPGLPRMQAHFADVPDAGLLVRLVLTIVALSVAVFSPVAGLLADRIGRKPLLVAGLILYALAGSGGLYLETLPALLAGRVLLGVAVACITTASSALIADVFSGPARTRFVGLQSAFTSFGGVLFLPLGGWLADLGWHAPFAVYFAALAMLPFALTTIHEPRREANAAGSGVGIPVGAWRVYALAFLSMIVFYVGPTQIPFLLQTQIGLPPSATGYVVALFTLSSAVTALQHARLRQRYNERTLTGLGFALLSLGWLVVGAAPSLWLILIGMVFAGLGGGLLTPNFITWLAQLAPASARGRVLGGLATAVFLGQFVSPILVQPVLAVQGLPAVFTATGGLALLVAVLAQVGRASQVSRPQ